MPQYAMLVLPAANRVYTDSAPDLMAAELEVFNSALFGGRLSGVERTEFGGVPYVVFNAPGLAEHEADLLANLSSLYALFLVEDGLLGPVRLRRLDRYDDDLISIPKYQGKTNEHFTKLLLNVTLLASDFAGSMLKRKFRVIDPLCGRGTTLNQALMYGFDAAGIDLDRKDFEAYEAFLKTWLKRKRLKHSADAGPVRRNKKVVGRRLDVTMADSKERYKAGDTQSLSMVNAETAAAGEFFRPGSFDLVVADAPYGVQHGSRTPQQGLRRAPQELVAEAAPVWAELLRPGGALGLSFNSYTADFDELAVELAEAGLETCIEAPFHGGFAHRVDSSIVRDLIVARKPASG